MYTIIIAFLSMAFVTGSLGAEVCTPGEMKMDDCNSCFCVNSDIGYACTKKNCGVTMEATTETLCEAGISKMEDCNYCFCVADGSGYACTRKKCPEVLLTCEPRQHFKEYCNSCTCGEDGLRKNAACTRKGCAPGVWNQDGSLVNPQGQQS